MRERFALSRRTQSKRVFTVRHRGHFAGNNVVPRENLEVILDSDSSAHGLRWIPATPDRRGARQAAQDERRGSLAFRADGTHIHTTQTNPVEFQGAASLRFWK